MRTKNLLLTIAVAIGIGAGHSVLAAGDLTAQTPIEVKVQLGDKDNAMRFTPNKLEFETGKQYKLVLHNASTVAHYFSSEGLARAVFTRKVQVLGASGKTLAEVKGSISEIEVAPGQTAEWFFVPVKTLSANDLRCTIKGHAEAGMVGAITIK